MRLKLLSFVIGLAWVVPSPAHADLIITPFIGFKFAGATNLVDLEKGAGNTKLTLGGSVGLLGNGILGVEADFAHIPHFFEGDEPAGLVTSSQVTTLVGSVILALPRSMTRDSLRPYAVAGLGLIHASTEYTLQVLRINSNLLGLALGGGAIGPLTKRTSMRFEVRYCRNLTKDEGPLVGFGSTHLTFWRATAGVTLRY